MKTFVVMLIAVFAATLGDILLSLVMRTAGEVRIDGFASLYRTGVEVFSQPKFWLALSCMVTFFVLFLAALSWDDLTYVMPITALSYVFNALLARSLLGEVVTPLRWTGTVVIVIGVILISLSHQRAS